MKEFIENLISRLEEEREKSFEKYRESFELYVEEFWRGRMGGFADAISIVNQLAEEYNNDFCEWKKTDKRKSSPYHHALKHGNITLEFHDDFKFCPYCGKKIKIAPYQPKGEQG